MKLLKMEPLRTALVALLPMATLVMLLAPPSAMAQVSFTDAPLTTAVAPKPAHVTELRAQIASLRALRALPVFAFTDPTLTSGVTRIRAVHLTELRSALNDVFDAASIARPEYSDASLAGVQLKRAHVEEIRAAVIDVKWRLQPKVQVTFGGTGAGTVSSASGLTCNLTCSGRFATGTSLTLAVTPVAGSQFNGWSGACTGTGSCQVTLTSDKAVTATFTKVTSTPPVLVITGIDKTTAKPFSLVTLTGSGFDPANSAISVFVSPPASMLPVAVPVAWATATTVTFAVPPLVDTYLGSFASGAVKLQVIAAVGSVLSTSSFFTGLSIDAPRSSPASTGKLMRAFLQSASNIADTTRPALGPGDLGTSLLQHQSELTSLIAAVNSIVANPNTTVPLPTENSTFDLNKAAVDVFDTLVLAYLDAYAAEMFGEGVSSAIPKTHNTYFTCPPSIDGLNLEEINELICRAQKREQTKAETDHPWVHRATKYVTAVHLTLPGILAASVTGSGAMTIALGKGVQLLWVALTAPLTTNLTAASKPPTGEPLSKVFTEAIDSIAAEGAAVLTYLRTSALVHRRTQAFQPSQSPNAVQRGIIVLLRTPLSCRGCRPVRMALCFPPRALPVLASSASTCPGDVQVFDLNAPLTQATIALDGSSPTSCNECYAQYERATSLCQPLIDAGQGLAGLQCVNAAIAAWNACLANCSGAPQPLADIARHPATTTSPKTSLPLDLVPRHPHRRD